MFCENGFLKEPGLIENIAQTAALRVGYITSQMRNDENTNVEPPIGYIGAIKNLVIETLPEAGSEIMTEVIIQNMVFDVTIIQGKISQNGQMIAHCEMKIFLKQ